jgi:heme/copper-type cytochrome/quinol oxidase subunit 1
MTPEQGPPPGWAPPPPGEPLPPGAPPGWAAYPPGYGTPKQNGFGVAALVLGILAVVTSFFGIGIFFGVLAIVFGVLGRGKTKRGEADNGGLALAGIITGALGVLVAAVVIASIALLANNKDFKNLTDCLNSADTQQEQTDCQNEFSANFGQ